MPYYDTLEKDITRAKEILERGRTNIFDGLTPEAARTLQVITEGATGRQIAGGTIYGADTYAAYKLLESFVAEIERLNAEVNRMVEARMALGNDLNRQHEAALDQIHEANDAIQDWANKNHSLIPEGLEPLLTDLDWSLNGK